MTQQRLDATKTQILLVRKPMMYFFSSLCRIPFVLTEGDDEIKTAATDGTKVWFDSQFVAGIGDGELMAVAVHELMHVALLHCWEEQTGDAVLRNIAMDLEINSVLVYDMGMRLPVGCIPGQGVYRDLPAGKTWRWYYSRLQQDAKTKPKPNTDGTPQNATGSNATGSGGTESNSQQDGSCPGDVRPAPESTPREVAQARVRSAMKQAQEIGTIPAAFEQAISNATQTRHNWKAELRQYKRDIVRGSADWSRPNRRLRATGRKGPTNRTTAIKQLAIAVDCSGSMSAELVAEMVQHVTIMAAEAKTEVIVIWHDSRVQRVDRWRAGQPVPVMRRPASGGTDHRPVFQWLADENISPALLVCLTDLYTVLPVNAPAYRVLWACPSMSGNRHHFGRKIVVS